MTRFSRSVGFRLTNRNRIFGSNDPFGGSLLAWSMFQVTMHHLTDLPCSVADQSGTHAGEGVLL